MFDTDEVQQIVDEFANRLGGGDSGDDGFVENPRGGGDLYYVFANREHFDTGHMIDDETEEPVQLPTSAIKGTLADLELFKRTYDDAKFDDQWKLRVSLSTEAGDRFMIEMGYGTNTCKTLLASLNEADDSVLTSPITIAFVPEEEQDSTLYANVHKSDGEAIMASKEGLDDVDRLNEVYSTVDNRIGNLGLRNTRDVEAPDQDNDDSGGGSQTQDQTQTEQPSERRQGGGSSQNGTPDAQQADSGGSMPTNTMPQ